MTFEGPEPRPPMAPPPPPPPDLAPPPGYAAYSQNLSSSVPLKGVGGIAKAIVIVLGVYIVGALVAIAGTASIVDSAEDFLAGRISESQYTDDEATFGALSGLSAAAQLAIVVLTIIWIYRITKNHRTIGRATTWGPGMAIGGWFLPPFLFVIPTLVLREAWKAADPAVPPGDQRWKSGPGNPLLWVWFVVYSVGGLVISAINPTVQFRQFGGDAEDRAEAYADGSGVMIALGISTIVGAVLWAVLVRQYTARHTALTGEGRR